MITLNIYVDDERVFPHFHLHYFPKKLRQTQAFNKIQSKNKFLSHSDLFVSCNLKNSYDLLLF